MGNEEAREELSRNRGLLTSHLIATKMTVYREYLPVNFHNLEFYETHPQRPTKAFLTRSLQNNAKYLNVTFW